MPKVHHTEVTTEIVTDCRLINGNAVNVLNQLPWHSVDLILTDPPYGIDYQTGYREKNKWLAHPEAENGQAGSIHNDKDLTILEEVLPLLVGKLKATGHFYCFCSPKKIDTVLPLIRESGLLFKSLIVWDKDDWGPGDLMGSYGNTYELVIHAVKSQEAHLRRRSGDILRVHKIHPRKQLHPHQKPVPLLKRLIQVSTDKGGLVVDPFSGSFSTALACLKMDRRFFGCELDPTFYSRGVTRLQAAHTQLQPEMKITPPEGGRVIS